MLKFIHPKPLNAHSCINFLICGNLLWKNWIFFKKSFVSYRVYVNFSYRINCFNPSHPPAFYYYTRYMIHSQVASCCDIAWLCDPLNLNMIALHCHKEIFFIKWTMRYIYLLLYPIKLCMVMSLWFRLQKMFPRICQPSRPFCMGLVTRNLNLSLWLSSPRKYTTPTYCWPSYNNSRV